LNPSVQKHNQFPSKLELPPRNVLQSIGIALRSSNLRMHSNP